MKDDQTEHMDTLHADEMKTEQDVEQIGNTSCFTDIPRL